MKSEQFIASLYAYSQLLHRAGCIQGGHELDALATVFEHNCNQTVAAVVKKIAKGRIVAGHVARYPALLKSVLEHIAAASKAAGATTIARDYEAVVSLFTGGEGEDASAFAKAAIKSLATSQAPAPLPQLDQVVISGMADRLKSASSNNAKFDAIVAELKTPRRYSNAILAAIANAYMDSERAFKNKSEILKAIANHQLQDAIQDSRDRRISRIAV